MTHGIIYTKNNFINNYDKIGSIRGSIFVVMATRFF